MLAALAALAAVPCGAQPRTYPDVPSISLPNPPDPIPAARDILDDTLGQLLDTGPLLAGLGPTLEGAVGAVITGKDRVQIPGVGATFVSNTLHFSMDAAAYLEYAVDGIWSGNIGNTSAATFSLRPGLGLIFAHWPVISPGASRLTEDQQEDCDAEFDNYVLGKTPTGRRCPRYATPKPWFSTALFGDVRHRYAQLEVLGVSAEVNQTILGGGLEFFLPAFSDNLFFREWPRIGGGYYTVEDTESSLVAVPPELAADFWQAHGRLRLNIPLFRKVYRSRSGTPMHDYPLRIHADVAAGRATAGPVTGWTALWTAELIYDTGSLVLPLLSYRDGSELGLDYDKQFVLGIAWRLTESVTPQ